MIILIIIIIIIIIIILLIIMIIVLSRRDPKVNNYHQNIHELKSNVQWQKLFIMVTV